MKSSERPKVESNLYWLALTAEDGSTLVIGTNRFADGVFVCNSESTLQQIIVGISDEKDPRPERMFWSDGSIGKLRGSCSGKTSRRENGDAIISMTAILVSSDGAFVIEDGRIVVHDAPTRVFEPSKVSRPAKLP